MDTYITGSTIRRIREDKGLTQSELAERLNISSKSVSKWETGRGYPDISMLEPLAEVLGISVSELMTGIEIRNGNVSGNMMRSKIYVCPVCGNVIHASGEAVISCCGISLVPEVTEDLDEAHGITFTKVEDETYVEVSHDMSKNHYISFLAYVTGDHFDMVKLYPEGAACARFKIRGNGYLYAYCNRHGLFRAKVKRQY